jgi:hypothetical protein
LGPQVNPVLTDNKAPMGPQALTVPRDLKGRLELLEIRDRLEMQVLLDNKAQGVQLELLVSWGKLAPMACRAWLE